MRPWFILGGIGLVVLLGVLLLLLTTPSQTTLPRPAPDFLLPDMSGQAVRLSQLKGKVVLLNVWATWCGPCRQEMPTMEILAHKLRDEGLCAAGREPGCGWSRNSEALSARRRIYLSGAA